MNWVRPSLSRRSLDKRLSRRKCGFIKSSAFPIRFYLRPESNAPAVPRPREKPGFSVSHGSRGGFWLKLRFTKSGRNPFHWCLVGCASSLAARAHARRCPTARIIRRLSDEATTEENCVVRRFNASSWPPPSRILPRSAADRPTSRVSRTFGAFNYRRRSLVSPVPDFAAAYRHSEKTAPSTNVHCQAAADC
jgi:hypothetical protein